MVAGIGYLAKFYLLQHEMTINMTFRTNMPSEKIDTLIPSDTSCPPPWDQDYSLIDVYPTDDFKTSPDFLNMIQTGTINEIRNFLNKNPINDETYKKAKEIAQSLYLSHREAKKNEPDQNNTLFCPTSKFSPLKFKRILLILNEHQTRLSRSPSNYSIKRNQSHGLIHQHQADDSIKTPCEVLSMIKDGSIDTIAKFLEKTPNGSKIYLIAKNFVKTLALPYEYIEVKKQPAKENDCSLNHSALLPTPTSTLSRNKEILRMFTKHEARSIPNNTNGDNREQDNRNCCRR